MVWFFLSLCWWVLPVFAAHRPGPEHLRRVLPSSVISTPNAVDVEFNQHPVRDGLEDLILFYQRQRDAGGWPTTLPSSLRLAVGQISEHVPALQQQLHMRGYPVASTSHHTFTADMREALKLFQRDRGLSPSGALNPSTIRHLNWPIEREIEILRVNFHRRKALPQTLPRRAVIVNIPTFQLWMFEGKKAPQSLAVVVGKPGKETPTLNTHVTSVVLHPTWGVPHQMAISKLAQFQKNPGRASAYHITDTRTGRSVSSGQVPWNRLHREHFPYRLQLSPGKHNPLGPLKINIAKGSSIILHGTNSPHLFQKRNRALSWGCVRISDPFQAAAFLLNNPKWTKESIRERIQRHQTKTIFPSTQTPVYLTYLTAWASKEGRAQFAPDVYNRDGKARQSLSPQKSNHGHT